MGSKKYLLIKYIFLFLILECLTSCLTPKYQYFGTYFESSSYSNFEYPFQVLFASNAYHSDLTQIENFDILNSDDSITIKNGSIILVHYLGYFLELDSNSVISIKQLDQFVSSMEFRVELPPLEFERPNIQHMYQNKSVIIGKGRISDRQDLRFNFSNQSPITVDTSKTSCISWFTSSDDYDLREYHLEIKNLYDEPIYTTDIIGNTFQSDFSQYFNQTANPLLVLTVKDKKDNNTGTTGLKIGKEQESDCDLFNVINASEAIRVGHKLEFANDIIGAKKMFTLATNLSENAAYEVLLENFLKRNNLFVQ